MLQYSTSWSHKLSHISYVATYSNLISMYNHISDLFISKRNLCMHEFCILCTGGGNFCLNIENVKPMMQRLDIGAMSKYHNDSNLHSLPPWCHPIRWNDITVLEKFLSFITSFVSDLFRIVTDTQVNCQSAYPCYL